MKRNSQYKFQGLKELDIFKKCVGNPFFFIVHYVKTLHAQRGLVDFNLFPFQYSVLHTFLTQTYNIILKPRQMGMSVLAGAYALWLANFHPHKKIMIVSLKLETAASLLRKIKEMYKHMPIWLKCPPMSGDYDDPGTTMRLALMNGSEIIISAATEDAGRSESLSLLIMDEAAIQRYAGNIWTGAQQTLATGGQAIVLSSAYGVGNFFHQTWVDAVQGLNGFFPIKLDWKMHPERDQAWYDNTLKLLGTKRVAQEVDCDFLTSGYNVFDMADIRCIEDRIRENPPVRTLMNEKLLIYKEPVAGMPYYLGADVAAGRDRDNSTFSIFDDFGVEHACFKSNIIGTRDFGHLLCKWGEEYNMAMLAPEVNAVGEGPLAIIQDQYYQNIYHRVEKTKRKGEYQAEESHKPGWYTNGKTRSEMITGMEDDLRDDTVTINNPFFVEEAYTFIYNEANKPIALGKELGKGRGVNNMADNKPGYSDDSIIAACIGNEVRKNPGVFSGALPIG